MKKINSILSGTTLLFCVTVLFIGATSCSEDDEIEGFRMCICAIYAHGGGIITR